MPVRAVLGTWMGASHLAGAAVRRVGTSARDLEPEHRRDGLGFTLIGLAVLVAAREWWNFQGVIGDVIHAVVAGTLGRVAYALPLVLLALGVRLLRAPEDSHATNRIIVGTTALTFAACGLAHLVDGIPNPPGGAEPMRAAGGIIGFLASSPLAAAVSTYGAVVLLVLLGAFGVLVVTATPVRLVPQRLGELRDRLVHPRASASGAPEEPPADETASRRRRRAVDLNADSEDRTGDEAFEQAAVVVPIGDDGRPLRPGEKRPTAPGVLAPGADGTLSGRSRGGTGDIGPHEGLVPPRPPRHPCASSSCR